MIVYWIHLPQHIDVTINGYVGIAHNFKQRMFGHKSCAKTGKEEPVYRAIRKHGWDNLIKEIILIADEKYCLEIEKKLRPIERIGWNLAIGGAEIIGINKIGKKQSLTHLENRKKALLGRVSGMNGKKHSKQSIEKIRLANSGKPKSKETNQKNAESHKQKIEINKIIYPSWQEASVATGIPTGSFSYLLKGKSLKSKWSSYNLKEVM